MNPYKSIPQSTILARWLAPAFGVLFFGFPLMGAIATSDDIVKMTQGNGRVPTAIVAPKYASYGPPLQASFQHFSQMVSYWANVPEVCWDGNSVNDFQKLQCEDFWNRVTIGTVVAATPFVLVLLFLFFALDTARGFYRKASKTIEKGQALFAGTVTQPAVARNDAFGWLNGLRVISVELKNKTQMRVYLPIDAPVPLPGQTLAIFDGGNRFGQKRHVGMLYAPHLAVVSGSR